MPQFRHRLKGKTNKHKKGISSSSNAGTTKFRDAAKLNFMNHQISNPSLTSEALEKHNAIFGVKNSKEEIMEVVEAPPPRPSSLVSSKRASEWSKCSNITFNRFFLTYNENNPMHREILAILAALTDLVKNKTGLKSDIEYFTHLTSILESAQQDSLPPILVLLTYNLKSLPLKLLRDKYHELTETFIATLPRILEAEYNRYSYQSVVMALTFLLRAQELSAWSDPRTFKYLDSLLTFCTHSKPKVRKMAQNSVTWILKGGKFFVKNSQEEYNPKKQPHPAASYIAQYFNNQMLLNSSSVNSTNLTTTLHILSLLDSIIYLFPHPELKTCCETILRLMTLSNPLIYSNGMQVFYYLFNYRPPLWCLPASLNGQLLTALYNYQPSKDDTQPMLAWIAAMAEAHHNLARLKRKSCIPLLRPLFSTLSKLWLSERNEVKTLTSRSLESLISGCLGIRDDDIQPSDIESHVEAILDDLRKCLSLQYHLSWHYVLYVHATLLQHCGPLWPHLMGNTLRNLGELRDSHKFPYPSELENAIMAAIKSMGPEIVLQHIPLKLSETGSCEFERSWMIPVLKLSIQRSRLQFFQDYFVPLATMCIKRSQECSEKDRAASYSYSLMNLQIWSLLPSFCNFPTDIVTNFKNIARTLGMALNEYKDLRMSVLVALRRLLTQATEDAVKAELGRFSKNFLPILFNLYVTERPIASDEEAVHNVCFEVIQHYLIISPPDQVSILYKKALDKLPEPGNEKRPAKKKSKKKSDLDMEISENEPGEKEKPADKEEIYKRICILDIVRALVPHQTSKEDVLQAYNKAANPGIGLYARHLSRVQKKSYRLLEVILDHHLMVEDGEFQKEVRKEIIQRDFIVSSGSKGARLRCLQKLLNFKENCTDKNFIIHLMPEVILSCKEINEKSRTLAYEMIVQIGQLFMDVNPLRTKDECIRDYLSHLLAGLAGSPNLCSATILALAKILQDMHEIMPEDTIILILENICVLIKSSTREIVEASLSFLKLYLKIFQVHVIGPQLSNIMDALLGMTNDCKRHFRLKTRPIFLKLIRKFGYPPIAKLVPTSDTILSKRLKNIFKTELRRKHGRSQNDDDDDDDNSENDNDTSSFVSRPISKSFNEILDEAIEDDNSDTEMEKEQKTKKRSKQKGPQTWITEDGESIIDLMDPSVNRNISTTNPDQKAQQMEKKKIKENPFKLTSDGRLIIKELSNESDETEKGISKKLKELTLNFESDSDEYLDEATTMKSMPFSSLRKRPGSSVSEHSTTTVNHYKPGGSGIHRPIKRQRIQSSASSYAGSEYRAKKAKGDIKKKGQLDPYAYVPLSRKALNRRKKLKSSARISSVVNSMKKGVKKGSKSRKK